VELARQLAGEKIAVRLIPDCLLGLATGEADAALIGADSLTPGGDVVNKAGTRLLALAAREDGVPLYCCAETLKIMSSEPEPGPAFPVQRRRPAEEIVARPPEQVEVLNLYFELTPWELISGYITERGILDRKYLRTLSIEMEEIVEKNIRRE
jgi:translation initiation factor 2B subunit (eIF-2B alpha/beta/delta family)